MAHHTDIDYLVVGGGGQGGDQHGGGGGAGGLNQILSEVKNLVEVLTAYMPIRYCEGSYIYNYSWSRIR